MVLENAASLKYAKLFSKAPHSHPRQECRGSLSGRKLWIPSCSSQRQFDPRQVTILKGGFQKRLIHFDGLLEMTSGTRSLTKSPKITGEIVMKNRHIEQSLRAS